MGEKKLTVFIFILFASSLLLFQNCGINNFTAGGNGDPHEGLDGGDSVIVNPPEHSDQPNPDAGMNRPDNQNSGPGKNIQFICKLEGKELEVLNFGTQSGHPRIFVSDSGESEKQFFWDSESLKARHEIYEPLSDKTLLEIVYIDQESRVVEVDYFRGNESFTALGTCIENSNSHN